MRSPSPPPPSLPWTNIEVSVVIPAFNEEGSIPHLIQGIALAMQPYRAEIVLVDDGSTDRTAEVAALCRAECPNLRIFQHQRSAGQSAAIRTGVHAARGWLIATLDADGQNPPENLPKLIAPFLQTARPPKLGLVQGQRLDRQDTDSKRLASKLANAIRSNILRDGVRDSGCGLKAFPRDLYKMIPYFDHLHRFMPAMIKREGYDVVTVDVTHAPRLSGESKYTNLQRALVGAQDLMAVAWLLGRRNLTPIQEIDP